MSGSTVDSDLRTAENPHGLKQISNKMFKNKHATTVQALIYFSSVFVLSNKTKSGWWMMFIITLSFATFVTNRDKI